jgi:SAM-dependent methyltransferase
VTDASSGDSSIVFDRAANYYDRTRALPAEVQERVTDLLFEELSGRGLCLEPGVGTGRMALPLHERGVALVGIDLSVPMMQRLVENAGVGAPFPLLRADLTCLPFRDGSFGAAFLCHVLHLIPNWRAAVSELIRVVLPGGMILIDMGGSATAAGREINREFARHSGQERPRPGVTDPEELDGTMAAGGAPLRRTRAVPEPHRYTINAMLARLESNQFSSTWGLDDATRTRAAAATRAWAGQRFGDLDEPRTEDAEITWRVYQRA